MFQPQAPDLSVHENYELSTGRSSGVTADEHLFHRQELRFLGLVELIPPMTSNSVGFVLHVVYERFTPHV